MHEKDKREQRLKEVEVLLEGFCKRYLSSELSSYVFRLWRQIGRKRTYAVTGGKKEIWASAIIYVIAHCNFLFDKDKEYSLTPDTICAFFGTKKSTVSSKAREIERVCRIKMGQEGLCPPELSDSLSFVQLPSGIVISKQQAKKMGML